MWYYFKQRNRYRRESLILTVIAENSHDGDFLWKAEFTYKHKNQSSNE